MEKENAIEVRDVKKTFKVYLDRSSQMKDFVIHTKRRRYEYRDVLKGISFDVKKGEAIGLVGHNGCGKSTTLKLLTRIMYPDSGSIKIKGRVSSLIELGAGFHPDMSGRENIYINASIFGLSRKEIDQRIDEIIAFSELEEFIDNPVRTYSSGMYMRLAFSVAINVNAEVLLIDEILAVGDANFQAKCFDKLRKIKAEGTTIVIVSHSLNQIEQICERSIWIHEGLIQMEGSPSEVHHAYLDYMRHSRADMAKKEALNIKIDETNRWGNGKARFKKITIMNSEYEEKNMFETGEKMIIRYEYEVNEPVEQAIFGIGIFRIDGLPCYGTNTKIDQLDKFDLVKDGVAELVIDQLNLIEGTYFVNCSLEQGDDAEAVDFWKEVGEIMVYSNIGEVGVAKLNHTWEF